MPSHLDRNLLQRTRFEAFDQELVKCKDSTGPFLLRVRYGVVDNFCQFPFSWIPPPWWLLVEACDFVLDCVEKRIKEELRRRMHHGVEETGKWLGQVLNGWLNYFAVPTSHRLPETLRAPTDKTVAQDTTPQITEGPLQRGQNEASYSKILAQAGIPTPVAEPTTGRQLDPREEPCALNAPARNCVGGAGQPVSLPRSSETGQRLSDHLGKTAMLSE